MQLLIRIMLKLHIESSSPKIQIRICRDETMEYKLSELFDLQMGKTPCRNNPEYWDSEDHKWISIGDLSKCGKYIYETKEYLSDKAVAESGISQIPANTVIMSFKLSIGKTAITPEPMYSNEAIMSFRDKKVVPLLPDYLFYMFSGKDWDAGTNKAVMGKTLNKATLSQIKIRVHSLPEQQEIVRVLDKTAAIIERRHQELQKLDELIKARFVELFGDPETNSHGWPEHPLSESLNVVGGYAFKSDGFDDVSGIPVLRIGNINAGFFRPVNLVFWKEDENLERYAMYPGDLVMSLTGTVGKDDYGNVCILGDDYEKYYLNQRNAKLEIKDGIDKYYLSQLLKFEQIKKKLTGISRGVRQANISNKDILNLVVPIPPMELQIQLAEFIKQVDKSKIVVQKQLITHRRYQKFEAKYFGY